jgi:hypothetical protein
LLAHAAALREGVAHIPGVCVCVLYIIYYHIST